MLDAALPVRQLLRACSGLRPGTGPCSDLET